LNDVLAEIRLDDFNALALEGIVEVGFLRDHRLALHSETGRRGPSDVGDDAVRLLGCFRPVDARAVGDKLRFEPFEVLRQVGDGVKPCRSRRIASGVRVAERRQGDHSAGAQLIGRSVERRPQPGIRESVFHAFREVSRGSHRLQGTTGGMEVAPISLER